MNLYLIKTKSIRHNYYVVAEHPTQAQEYLKKLLDLAGYDFSANRDAIEITFMAELVTEKDWNGYPDFHEGNNLLIVKEETEMSEAVTNKCAKCGGILWGRPETTNDFMCLCAVAPKPTLHGWECPRCHKIHSPFSLTCNCMPDYVIYITDNTKEEPK